MSIATNNNNGPDALYIIRSVYVTNQGRVYLTNIKLREAWETWEYDKTNDITWAHTFTVRQAAQMMRLKAQDVQRFECVEVTR